LMASASASLGAKAYKVTQQGQPTISTHPSQTQSFASLIWATLSSLPWCI